MTGNGNHTTYKNSLTMYNNLEVGIYWVYNYYILLYNGYTTNNRIHNGDFPWATNGYNYGKIKPMGYTQPL